MQAWEIGLLIYWIVCTLICWVATVLTVRYEPKVDGASALSNGDVAEILALGLIIGMAVVPLCGLSAIVRGVYHLVTHLKVKRDGMGVRVRWVKSKS